MSLKYDLRILRPQCYNCNINLGGMGAVFYVKLLKEKGKQFMNVLEKQKIQDKRGLIKGDVLWLEMTISEYEAILSSLPNEDHYVSII